MSREMPAGWRQSSLGDLIKLEYGRALAGGERREGAVPVFGSSGVVGYHDKAAAAGPSIVISRKGSLGGVFYVEGGFWPIDTTYFVVQRENSDWRWLTYLLKFASLERLNEATGVPGLNRDKAAKEQVFVPPLHEQRRIAAILSSVDEAIASTRAVIEQTRKVKQGVLERLLTKGVGHTRFKQTEIGEIPEAWEARRLADLAEDSRNSFVIGPFGSDLTVKDYCAEGVPVVFVRDVQSDRFRWKSEVYVSPEKAEKLRAHSARPGDIVITKMGLPPGIASEIPSSFENSIVTADIVRLRPNTTIASSAFLALALNGKRVAEAVAEITGGQTRPKITLRDYKCISLALPPMKEQREIVANIEPLKTLVECETSKLDKLIALKSALMCDLLTGRKPVTDALPMAAE